MITVEDLKELHNKMYEIWKMPKYYDNGRKWDGVEISTNEESKLIIRGVSRDPVSCNCCRDEIYSFYVEEDEINKPLSYFEDKYKKEIEEKSKDKEYYKEQWIKYFEENKLK